MSKKCSILFVDDEFRVIKLLNMMFRAQYEVHTATSGAEALAILDRHSIDIVCSDQRMPGMLGIELLSEVRKRSPRTMRLLLTGYSDLVAIIGAVNEGEVYRFINKPWNHDEIKAIIAECAAIVNVANASFPSDDAVPIGDVSLASAAKLLAVDGISVDRHEIMEMFTENYDVVGASSLDEAIGIIDRQEVGVVVMDANIDGDPDKTLERLRSLKRDHPFLTVVMLSNAADSDTIIRMINQAHIYRFAMKPISPSVFRLAVSAAMREHHRLLADPALALRHVSTEDASPDSMVATIVHSLSRFTKIW
jgi:DNA-binding NtrC family response regulator